MSPPSEWDVFLPSFLLPALAPQPRGGASNGAPGWSAAAHPTPCLPVSPHRVDSSQLAGALPPPSSTPPSNVALTVAPTWAQHVQPRATTAPQYSIPCHCTIFVLPPATQNKSP
jgi:hypothetical protein